ncbi:MAG: hypothetical protein ABIR71_11965 [Chthoniobacterales bacterium]
MKTAFACLFLAAAASLLAASAETFQVERFTFTVPADWKKVAPPSPMRKAQLEVGMDAAKAEVTFFHFGGGSGSAADNVARWYSQFPGSEATQKSENVEANGVKITFVEAAGTFNSGMPGGPTTPMPDYAMQGAILENTASGDVYVKMTGPKATVEGAAPAFRKMVMDVTQSAAK